MRKTLASILLIGLSLDIAYGIVASTFHNPYDCTANNQNIFGPGQTATDGANLQVLGNPCFYAAYFAIVGGCAFVITLFAPPKMERKSSGEEVR